MGFADLIRSCIVADKRNPTIGIIGGIVSIILGCALFVGVIKVCNFRRVYNLINSVFFQRNIQIVFTYFCMSVGTNLLSTLVIIFALFESPLEFSVLVIVVLLLIFLWSLEYGLYLYYKDLKNEQDLLGAFNRETTINCSSEYIEIDTSNVDIEKNMFSFTKQNSF